MKNAVVIVALAKLLEKLAEKNRSEVEPGSYNLDKLVTVRLRGVLDVAEDTEYTPTCSLPWKTVLALFVRYSGITREKALETLVLAMQEALKTDKDAAKLLSETIDLDEAEARVQACLGELPKQSRKGQVATKGVLIEELHVSSGKKAA